MTEDINQAATDGEEEPDSASESATESADGLDKADQRPLSNVSTVIGTVPVGALSAYSPLINQTEAGDSALPSNLPAVAQTGSPWSEEERLPENRELSSRYQFLRKIGEGGLGTVWLARDQRLKRNVAVKQLKAAVEQTDAARARFHREAEITGLLEHPNVVPLYQFGEDRDSKEPLYAMRFVGKRTLADAIVEHRDRVDAGESPELGLHRLLSAFLGVCQAIAYAHSRGVIHRDLKPANVALDSFGQVIVLDWGLAKLTEDSELTGQLTDNALLSESALRFTTYGDVIGSPLYMAPEQALGDLDKVNKHTDIYGLGAMLFAILTGTAPHEQSLNENRGAGAQAVFLAIAEGNTPAPRDIDNRVPRDLGAICTRAMATKQHLRYDSVEDLAQVIERWMAGQASRQQRYEGVRNEGRELVAGLRSTIFALERNVEFMSHLPPIQELLRADSDEDVAVWRERLSIILHGLLEANREYRTAMFCRLDEDRLTEMVRIERHGLGRRRIRKVPRSRLRTVPASDYLLELAKEKPDEVVTGLVEDPLCERDVSEIRSSTNDGSVGLVSGVPVYDQITEEPFGLLLIDCDIEHFLQGQFSREWQASEVLFRCDDARVCLPIKMSSNSGGSQLASAEWSETMATAVDVLQTENEYVDETNTGVFGIRLSLPASDQNLLYLLKS